MSIAVSEPGRYLQRPLLCNESIRDGVSCTKSSITKLSEKVKGKLIRYVILVLVTVQTSTTVLCLRYSRSSTGDGTTNSTREAATPPYSSTSLVLTSEVVKLLLTLLLIFILEAKCSLFKTGQIIHGNVVMQLAETSKVALPAFLYVVQNHLVIYALTYLNAATYQATYQVRILTTAIFSVNILSKKLFPVQWVALALLMSGVVLVQLPTGTLGISGPMDMGKLQGIVAVFGAALTSGYAGVYNEKLLKDGNQPSLLLRNVQLGLFSSMFAFVILLSGDVQSVLDKGFFYGFNNLIWIIVTLQAGGGILIAACMKYTDNIAKNFATSTSIVLSTLCSHYFFHDLLLENNFIAGTAMIVLSTFLYGYHQSK